MKEYIKRHKSSITVIAIFCIFALFLLFQHQFLYLYHDDYGYSTLSYLKDVPIDANGTNFSIFQIFEFLVGHYLKWGGRVLAFFFEIAGLHYLTLTGFRIMQATIILGIFILIYKILRKSLSTKIKNWILALVTITLYGVTEITTFKQSFFWITASVLYVLPIFFLLLFIYLYSFKEKTENKSKIKKFINIILMSVSIFLATFSQEQIAVVSLMYIVIWTIYHIIKDKKVNKLDILFTIISLIGFLILMLAPGNEIRKQHPTSASFYQLPFLERTGKAIINIIVGNFKETNKIFSFLFFSTALLFSFCNIQKKQGNKYLNILSLISTSGIFLMTFIKQEGYFKYVYNLSSINLYKLLIAAITVFQLGLIAYEITIYLWKQNKKELTILFWCGILSQAAMAVAPYFPLRSTVIFQYIYYLIGINIIGEMYSEKYFENQKIIISAIFIPFLILCILNMVQITRGYQKNDKANKENNNKLITAHEQIEEGQHIDKIILQKLPDIKYSVEQPYMEGYEYILKWIKKYYGLPNEIDIQYE